MTAATPDSVHHDRADDPGSGSRPRQVVIVGGVAGGMSTATRLRRLDESAEIVVLERSGHVSYANCGLPYFVGGIIEDEDDLLLQTPERLHERFRLDVRVDSEVVGIDADRRTVTVRPTADGASPHELHFDTLVLSPGAVSIRPPIPGFDRVRALRTVEDAKRLFDDVGAAPRQAVVIGAGFIGLETAENLAHAGIGVTVVEAAPQVLTPLDPELAVLVEAELLANGVAVETGVAVTEVTDDAVVLADGRSLPADLVVGSIGVRPDTRLAELAGLELGPFGGIAVDGSGRTSHPDIYAVGDAVEKDDAVGGGPSLIALANVANRQGRRVADHIAGLDRPATPSTGTAIVKVFGRTAAMTGWNETRLRNEGRPFRAIHAHPWNHATYYPGAEQMSLKLLFDPADGAILGAQAVGGSGVDKRIDVLATAMAAGIRAPQLADLDLAYAPPFSSAKDPVNMLGYMSENILSGECDVVEADEVSGLRETGWTLLDVRTPAEFATGSIPGAVSAPLDDLRADLRDGLGTGPFLVFCQVGQRGHTATELLHELGYRARNLDGGITTWRAAEAARTGTAATLVTPRR